jgi:hypothetical protein
MLAVFHPLHEPTAHGSIGNVHELHADRAAISVAQAGNDFAQCQDARSAQGRGGKLPIEISIGQAMIKRFQLGNGFAREPQRIHLGHEVPLLPIRSNQLGKAFLFDRGLGYTGRFGWRGRRELALCRPRAEQTRREEAWS